MWRSYGMENLKQLKGYKLAPSAGFSVVPHETYFRVLYVFQGSTLEPWKN